jgi:hypothetical protein
MMHKTYTTTNITQSTIIDRHQETPQNTVQTTRTKKKKIKEKRKKDAYALPPNLYVAGSTNLSLFIFIFF